MKANYKATIKNAQRKNLENEVSKEARKQCDAIYEQCAKEIAPQLMAVVLYTLHISFGYGEKRLKDFMASFNGTESMMMEKGAVLGRNFDADDIKTYVEKKFNIKLDINEIKFKEKGLTAGNK